MPEKDKNKGLKRRKKTWFRECDENEFVGRILMNF